MKIFDKVFLGEAANLLGLQEKPLDYVAYALIKEEGSTAFFDVNVAATHFNGYDERPINQEGDTLPYVDGQAPYPIEGTGKKILSCDIEGGYVSVHTFEHDGKQYCGADDAGDHPRPVIVELDYIYFEKSEILSAQDLPPYQDRNHEHYAPELDLAIQLHQAIFIDKYGKQAWTKEARVSHWLKANYGQFEFSDAGIKRLSAVISGKPLKEKKK